jgi:alkyl sulfatase BDS1-like metallo-beta-lactamase superfamily hydrolase
MWQSLAYGPNYKAAYCLAVCPAGEEVIAPFLANRKGFLDDVVRPLQSKVETLYVQPNSDAEAHARKRFPHKTTKRVGAVLRPASVEGFIRLMRHGFQPGRSVGLTATYHFQFTGDEPLACTVTIHDRKIEVQDGLQGTCDLRVTADSRSWLRMLRKQASVVRLLLTRKIRLKGNPRLLVAYGKCFP